MSNNIISPTIRMYVDENGNYNLHEDLDQDSNRFLCLTGVVMRLETHDVLTEQLDDLKLKFFGDKSIALHRREIISAKPPFSSLKDPITRDEFNTQLLSIMKDLKYGVISIVIDKKTLVDRYGILRAHDPYALGLEYLMQRYQYWMQDSQRIYVGAKGDILAEARGGKEDRITKETYKLVYNGEGYNKLKNASQFFSSKEIKLKKKKDNIAGLQFVDLISHPARRYILTRYNLAKDLKKTSFEQNVVDILVEKKFRRFNGKIDGVGAVLFPK